MEIPVQINSNGKSILGIFHISEKNAAGSPTIVACYGLDGNRVEHHRMSVMHGRYAEAAGVNLLRFDFTGLGVSEGEFWQTSIRTKIDDVIAVIEFVIGCFQKKRNTIIVSGFSDGARIATDVAKIYKEVKGICLWNPIFFPMVSETDYKGVPLRLVREPKTKELVCQVNGLWMGIDHLKQQKTIGTAFTDFNNFIGRKLAVFGREDSYTIQSREELLKANDNLEHKAEIVSIPDAGHLFNHTVWANQVISKTVSWAIEVGKLNS